MVVLIVFTAQKYMKINNSDIEKSNYFITAGCMIPVKIFSDK